MRTAEIGKRMGSFMTNRGISIEDLSEMTGLDKEFIKAIQEKDVYPSLGPLLKISRALGIRLGTLIDDKVSYDPLIIRRDERKEEIITHRGIDKPVSLSFHSLGRGKVDRHMEPFIIEVFPESSKEKILSSHEGEEFIIVNSGKLNVIYGQDVYVLETGDSIYYNSIVPHYVSCHGDEVATITAVLYFPD